MELQPHVPKTPTILVAKLVTPGFETQPPHRLKNK